jgi:hypothetical protein
VGVSKLVWREPAADARRQRGAMQLRADRGRGARPAAGRTAHDAEQGADREPPAELEPGVKLLPRPAVHPDLSPTTALSRTNQNGAALPVKIGLGQRERLADPKPGTPEHDDHPRSLMPSGPSPAARMTAMISSTVGGSGG